MTTPMTGDHGSIPHRGPRLITTIRSASQADHRHGADDPAVVVPTIRVLMGLD